MFRERIKTHYADLSPSFQRLAKFLMDHPYEAAFMTATQLGRHLDVDTATVVRFAQRLEYPGFPELLDEIQSEVKTQLVRYFQPSRPSEDGQGIFRAAIRQALVNIEQLDLALPQSTLERIVEMIRAADRIWVTGENLNRPLADLLARVLRWYDFNALPLSTEASQVAVDLRTATSRDLIIAVAVSQYSPDVTSIVEVARQRGVKSIALAGAESWSVSRAATVTLVCPYASPTHFHSLAATAVAIDALFQTLFYGQRDRLVGEIVHFEETLRNLMTTRGQAEIAPLLSDDVVDYAGEADKLVAS